MTSLVSVHLRLPYGVTRNVTSIKEIHEVNITVTTTTVTMHIKRDEYEFSAALYFYANFLRLL